MKRHTAFYLALILALLAASLAACGARPTDEPAPTATEAASAPTDTPIPATQAATAPAPETGSLPPVDGETTTTTSGLEFVSVEEGTGPMPQPGEVVTVNYVGMLEDGTTFDSSYSRGEPISFPLGQGHVIPGWEEGIAMMHEGGKARLIIPPDLAYGDEGAGGVIPPGATLIFDVELLSISEGSPDTPTQVDPANYVITDSGLKYYDIQVGDGATAEPGVVVRLNYTGWLEDGTKFDSSIDRGSPVSFPLGEDAVLPGWEEGVTGMKVGGKRQIIIPPDLAYGSEGAGGGVIPPDATIVLDVELLDIMEGAPAGPTEVDPADYVVTDSGLKYYDLAEGMGPTAEIGERVQVHYTGWLEDGTKFDSSLDRGEPFSFILGSGQVIQGWDEGVAGMKVGGRRQLVIPPDLGYGSAGAGEVIPPDATLIFEIELLTIQGPQ
ncbi:MAG: FKBP-type peptidyl-prolyl cis-trans isomerase [Anaerolineae bacterium]